MYVLFCVTSGGRQYQFVLLPMGKAIDFNALRYTEVGYLRHLTY